MKNIMRLTMALIFCVTLILCLASAASAETIASGTCGDNLIWMLNNEGTLIISGEGEMYDYCSYPSIGTVSTPWLSLNTSIKAVKIENGVTSIGNGAFYCCRNLTSVVIPDSISKMGCYIFYGCSKLNTVGPIGSGCNIEFGWTEEIPDNSFCTGYDIISVILPDGLTRIGGNAFACCDFSSILIPDSVTSIGEYAFYSCDSLMNVDLPKGLSTIDIGTFIYCDNLRSVTIPISVDSIKSSAFKDCGINTIYYGGTEYDWENIRIGVGNECLMNAEFNYHIHHMEHIEKKDSSCNDIGYEEYWICELCERAFSDETGVKEIAAPIVIPPHGHSTKKVDAKLATCTEPGHEAYWICVRCNQLFQDSAAQTAISEPVETKVLGHLWSNPVYVWADDNSTVTASHVCRRDQNHTETETVAVTSEIKMPATCESMGKTKYTSLAFDIYGFEIQTKTISDIDAIGHDWGKPVYSWADDKSTVTATRTCRHDNEHVETETVTVTATITIPATCETKGKTTYRSAEFDNDEFAVQVKTLADIPALGHDWSEPLYVWADDNSAVTASRVCRNNNEHKETEIAFVTSEITTAATCEEMGETTYTSAAFENEAFSIQEKTLTDIPAHGHTPITDEAIEATCTTTGLTEGSHCAICGKELVKQEIVPIADHKYIIVAAIPSTCEETGLTAHVECSVCGHILIPANETPALGHDWNKCIYTWAEDNSTVTATKICSRNKTHTDTETVNAHRIVTLSPTQSDNGRYKWVSDGFVDSVFEAQEHEGGAIPALEDMNVIMLPASLTRIDSEAFAGISAEAIVVPEGCTIIEPKAFMNCKNLLYIRIPTNVDFPNDAVVECPNVVIDNIA